MNSFIRCVIIISLAIKCCRSEITYCKESVDSASSVSSCPDSEEERDKAARKKNCNEIAKQQTCAHPEKFKYHCVINGYRDSLLEVCAPERIILGHCTEFNVIGGVIQDHHSVPCKNGSFPKCDRFYLSSDAYKYPDCYHLVKQTTAPKETSTVNEKIMLMIAVIAAVLIFILFAVSIVVCRRVYVKRKITLPWVRFRRRKPYNSQQRESGEISFIRGPDYSITPDQWQSSASRCAADFNADNGANYSANCDNC